MAPRATGEHRTTHAIARRGLMLVLSSPSGAGKTTLSRVCSSDTEVELSVSVTTRPPRPGEIDGAHYHFIDAPASSDGASTASCSNGPRCSAIATARRARRSRRRWRRAATCCSTSTGRAPSSCARRRARSGQRLRAAALDRASWSAACAPARRIDEVIHGRMAKAADEMSHWAEYDYVIVNRDSSSASPRCARSFRPSASSASARPGCRISCARCRRGCRPAIGFVLPKLPLRGRLFEHKYGFMVLWFYGEFREDHRGSP